MFTTVQRGRGGAQRIVTGARIVDDADPRFGVGGRGDAQGRRPGTSYLTLERVPRDRGSRTERRAGCPERTWIEFQLRIFQYVTEP